MKELSIEEKAKAYDKAIKVAADIKAGIATYITDGTPVIDAIFPELKESEDERIKNLIYCLIRDRSDNRNLLEHNGVTVEQALSWLEKQGERNLADGTFVNVDDVREDFVQEVYRVLDADSTNDRANQIIDAFDNLPTVTIEVLNGKKVDNANKVEQKPAWSEEDEINLERAIWYVEHPAQIVIKNSMLVEWLKSLKGRVQPKQEWSEEDEYCRHQLMAFCKNCMVQDAGAKRCAHWLKSLRPQNHWKPSDEQIKAVKEAACYSSVFSEKTIDNLISLSKDLKKLKG